MVQATHIKNSPKNVIHNVFGSNLSNSDNKEHPPYLQHYPDMCIVGSWSNVTLSTENNVPNHPISCDFDVDLNSYVWVSSMTYP